MLTLLPVEEVPGGILKKIVGMKETHAGLKEVRSGILT